MYIFNNIFKNIRIYKNRNIILFIVIFIMALICCLSLTVWQASKKYEEANSSLMSVAVDLADDSTDVGMESLYISKETLGTNMNFSLLFESELDDFDDLYKYVQYENTMGVFEILNMRLRGSGNLKSYILDTNEKYQNIKKSKWATAFSDNQYVNLMGSLGDTIEMLDEGQYRIDEGKFFDKNSIEYECIVDVYIAKERNLHVGDMIVVRLNEFQYEVKIVGTYTSNYIDMVLNDWIVATMGEPIFLNKPIATENINLPSIYVNTAFYEEIETKKSAGMNLDFNVIGLPADDVMTDFISGATVISKGRVFNPLSDEFECIISENLAKNNSIRVGDEISLRASLENSKEYVVKVVGIYYDSAEDHLYRMSFSGREFQGLVRNIVIIPFRSNAYAIPLDLIYMSTNTLKSIKEDIEKSSGVVYPALYNLKIVFNNTSEMNTFYNGLIKVDYKMGKRFATAIKDVRKYFDQLAVIKRTTTFALIIFGIVLAITIIFLLMFNAYNMRERQYEIGVLASMGMTKWKIAVQFFLEVIIIVITAAILGSGVATIASEPIGDILTKQGISNREEQELVLIENFGREAEMTYLNNALDPTIDASVTFATLLWIWGTFAIVTILSTSGTISFILKFEPIAILNDRQ